MPYISKIKLPDNVTYDINLPSTAQINIDSINGLSANAIKSGVVHTVMSGFTTTNGSSTSGSYLSVKWTINGIDEITTPYDGMKVMIKIPKVGVSTAGAVMSIDNGTTYHPLSYDTTSVLVSQYAVDTVRMFTYDASASMTCYLSSGTATSVTGVWKGESKVGSVTSVRVQAGTGLSSSTSSAQTSSLNTTISIDSGYKLPTTTEWSSVIINPMTQPGDIIIGGTSGAPTKLTNPASKQYLSGNSGTTAWSDIDGVEIKSHTTAGGSTNATSGYVLTADGSGSASWVAASGGMSNPMTRYGDLIYGSNGTGTPGRLGASVDRKFLRSYSSTLAWDTVDGVEIKSHTTAGGSTNVTSGKVLTADGSGSATWKTPTTTTTGTLASASWSSSSQTITVNGVTSSNLVVVSPAPASVEAYGNARIYCSAQSTNSLTFTCLGTTPSTDLTVNIAIW